jgi:ComF family protein
MALPPVIARWMDKARPCATALGQLLFPTTCRVCDVPLQHGVAEGALGRFLCSDCAADLPSVEPPYCSICGAMYAGAITGAFRCDNCADRKFAFDYAISSYCAAGKVMALIHRYKYNRDLSLRDLLAQMLGQVLAEDARLAAEDLTTWTLVPVPLHRLRQREREFNQSWELCRMLAKTTGIPALNAMQRVLATGHQASLTRKQRLENLRNAFAMKPMPAAATSPLAGARVLLVDDVFTTGATTDACARVLRRQGQVEKVVVITVARG